MMGKRWPVGLFATAICIAAAPSHGLDPVAGTAVDEHGMRLDPRTTPASAAETTGVSAKAAGGWTAYALTGGDVSAIAASPMVPGLVLAGTLPSGSGSLYRSTDGGVTWSRVDLAVGAGVFDIAFAGDGRAFIGTGAGLHVGSVQADQFQVLNLGTGSTPIVNDVDIAQGAAGTIRVGLSHFMGVVAASLLRSDDGGATWTDTTPPGAFGGRVSAIGTNPGNPNQVLAAVLEGSVPGIWASSDGGLTWTDRSAGLRADAPVLVITHDGGRFLVGGGTLFAGQVLGLHTTSDLGQSWTALHDASWPQPVVNDLAIDPADPGVLVVASNPGGIHRSVDGGATWQVSIGGTQALAAEAVGYVNDSSSTLLAGVRSHGIYRSVNAGSSFVQSSAGMQELDATGVAMHPTNPMELAVSFGTFNSGGVVRSIDGGRTWSIESAPPTRYSAIAYAIDGTLYALSSGPTTIAQEGLYRRRPDGSWVGLGPDQGPLFESDLTVLAVDPEQAGTVHLGGADFGSVQGTEGAIWRTTDAGASWSRRHEGESRKVIVDIEHAAGEVMLATFDDRNATRSSGVLRSPNRGIDWAQSNSGLPASSRNPLLCKAPGSRVWLAIFPTGASAMYRSDDAGRSWQGGASVGREVRAIACDQTEPEQFYLGIRQSPWVLRSRDGAASFENWGAGIGTILTTRALSSSEGRLLLASPRGVYRSARLEAIFDDGFDPP